VEDPRVARFLEEEPLIEGGPPAGADGGSGPVVTPFSPNATAAEALLREHKHLLTTTSDGVGPHLLLAGDHPLIEAILLVVLRRWRSEILRAAENEPDPNQPTVPPFRVSVYGSDAIDRADAFVRRWSPESHVLELEAQNTGAAGSSAREDQWLRERREARYAVIICNQEIESVRLTLEISGAMGGDVTITRVATQSGGELDRRLEKRTKSRDLATTKVREIAELGWSRSEMSADARRRLQDVLDPERFDRDAARGVTVALFDDPELKVHSDSTWRVLPVEQPLVEALVRPVRVSELVRARLAPGVRRVYGLV